MSNWFRVFIDSGDLALGGNMKRFLWLIQILVIFWSPLAGQSKLDRNFDKLAQEILENLQSFFPVNATEKGVHAYDDRFTDYSRKSVSSEVARLKNYETRLFKYKKSGLSAENGIRLQLIKSNVDMALHDLNNLKSYEKNPYTYVNDAVNGIYLILVSDYAPLDHRALDIIARLKAVPDLLAGARKNLKNPPPLFINMAHDVLATGIDFYRSVEGEVSPKVPELAPEIHDAVAAAVVSMQEFDTFLEGLTPGEPGSFAIGKDNFNYCLKNQYLLDFDADSLLKIGQAVLETANRQYDEYLAMLDSTKTDDDTVFTIDCIDKNDILRYYNWEVEQTKRFLLKNDIVSIPEDIGECKVVETPPFLTDIISGIAYLPPGNFSAVQTGYFFVRPIPDSMDQAEREARYRYINRRGFKGSVVHEAYPGHHLQSQMASRIADDVRKWQDNSCFVEGWALYCEEMMYQEGFYGADKRPYLNILSGIALRAARIIVDVKLHTGQMTLDEAVQWMGSTLNIDTGWVRIEVNRYALTPTIPMSCLIGKLEILKLRDAVKARQGDDFSLKTFHDRLLAEGAIPPRLIWDIWGLAD
jgi:uncharacterized protein (DUF885 family)